jgi:hypothetical protein
MKTTYPIETKHQFIQLRARDISLSKISEQLNVPKSTLGTWNQDHEAEINCLKRIEWEEVEAQFANSITDDLKRIMHRIRRLEKELDERDPGYFETRELLAVIKESRREYDRKRSLYLADPPPKRDKTVRPTENGTGDLPLPRAAGASASAEDRANLGRGEGQTSSPEAAPQPLDESVRSTESRPTQPRNTNDLQQSQPESSDLPPSENISADQRKLAVEPQSCPKLAELDPDDPNFYDESIVISADDSARSILEKYGITLSNKPHSMAVNGPLADESKPH